MGYVHMTFRRSIDHALSDNLVHAPCQGLSEAPENDENQY